MIKQQMHFSLEEIQNNHEIYLERSDLYIKFGFDREKAGKKITDHLFKDHESILEIGTGKGYLTIMLAHSFNKILSVDLNSDDQRIAGLNAAFNKQLDKIKFKSADAGKLNFPDKSFDAAVSAFTFHHLDLPFKVISEMIRLTKRQIVISDFNRKGFDVIDKVHRNEGTIHEIKNNNFDIVGVYLKELNFTVNVIEDEYQTIYSAVRK